MNLYRARFIRAARRANDVAFEGGLVSRRNDAAALQFEDCFTRPLGAREYLQRVKRSAFVFNTPAYWGCHGWKLAEYMALGKAVLSTPLIDDLPAPLEHGKHIHFVDGSEASIEEGVRYMVEHPDYCQYLGQNIRAYWQQYGSPEATLRLLGFGS